MLTPDQLATLLADAYDQGFTIGSTITDQKLIDPAYTNRRDNWIQAHVRKGQQNPVIPDPIRTH